MIHPSSLKKNYQSTSQSSVERPLFLFVFAHLAKFPHFVAEIEDRVTVSIGPFCNTMLAKAVVRRSQVPVSRDIGSVLQLVQQT